MGMFTSEFAVDEIIGEMPGATFAMLGAKPVGEEQILLFFWD